MRCDLHVHTRHSGMCNIPLLRRCCRESYNEPQAIYETLKARGMDLVTVTDHDSIDAAEALLHFPDFFLSEEVTCTTPDGTEIHVGVYGIGERDHIELQRRRSDVPALAAYLGEQRIFFSINHAFSSLTGRRTDSDFALFQELFPAMETRNGAIRRPNNAAAALLARWWNKSPVAGSDAHTLSGLGRTYTEVRGVQTRAGFLEGLRRGRSRACGVDGGYVALTRAVSQIGLSFMREKRWAALLAPLLIVVPIITGASYAAEVVFEYRWSQRTLGRHLLGVPIADPLLEVADVGK